jgi:hypothetical protein
MAKVSKAKNVSAGVAPQNKKKVGPVDAKGAYTKVQERTIGKMKMGGPVKKTLKPKPSVKSNVGGSDDVSNPFNYGPKKEWLNTPESNPNKNATPKKKAKNGGSFPDLNKDGKVTKADILKGRGVIAKKGASVKKCRYGCK